MSDGAVRLLYHNRGLEATWSASSQASTMPARNLNTEDRNEAWWATGCADEYVEAAFSGQVTIRGLALVGGNLTPGATVTLTAGAAAAPATVYVTGTPWETDGSVLVWFPSVDITAQFFRVRIQDAANPEGRIKVGVVVLSPLLDLGRANAFTTLGEEDLSVVDTTASGTPHVMVQPVRRRAVIPMAVLDKSLIWPTARQAFRRMGTARCGVLSLKGLAPSADDFAKTHNIYGYLTAIPKWTPWTPDKWDGDSPEFVEAL